MRDVGKTQLAVLLPTELRDQVAAKAMELSVSFDVTVETLLRYGLECQREREERIASVTEMLVSSTDETVKEALGNELGGMIFGH